MKHLFCDCKTDEEKANFFLSGRAVETGIIAPAISNDVAMAYHRCAEFQKEIYTLRAKITEMEQQEPFDADSDVFRSAFEAALKAGNWPATRQGDGYRSPSTQIAWRIAFSTVNRLKLYLAPGAQPAPSFADAYQGAMEEVAIWKKRALEAEDLNRKFVAEINGPTYMGEPAQPAPSVPDDMVEQAVSRFLSWKLPKDFHPDGGMVFVPTKGRGYDSPHWPVGTNLLNAQQAREMLRYVLAASPEAKP